MCWYGTLELKQIAEKNIHCKKIIAYNPKENYYFPYYVRHGKIRKYEFGKTYTSDIAITNNTQHHCCIHNGLHCYSNDLRHVFKTINESSIVITDNYGGNNYFGYDKLTNRLPVLVHCVIPKGATYYENKYGEIVTDKLQIVEKIRIKL